MTFSYRVAGMLGMLFMLAVPAKGWISISTNYYEVFGNSEFELRQALETLRPAQFKGRMDAHTKWEINWTYTFSSTANGCRLRSFRTKTDITVTMPKWNYPSNAPPSLIQKWNNYLRALALHEAGHIKLAVAADAHVSKSVNSLSGEPGCEALEGSINRTAKKVLAQFRENEVQYDQKTNHGATQRARFP